MQEKTLPAFHYRHAHPKLNWHPRLAFGNPFSVRFEQG
jgi:hypothetical protein